MLSFAAVFLGGGIGAVCRYIITKTSEKLFGMAQIGTFTANIAGCFLIGLIFGITYTKINILPTHVKAFITVGFLGGLTTFSTFSLESFAFLKEGKTGYFILYVSGSLILGLISTYAGYLAGRQI